MQSADAPLITHYWQRKQKEDGVVVELQSADARGHTLPAVKQDKVNGGYNGKGKWQRDRPEKEGQRRLTD